MIINRESKYKGYLNIDEITFKNKKGKEVKREVMNRKNAVSSLVYDTVKKQYVFVSQWRPATSNNIIEIPAGVLDHGDEDPRNAIIREIEEEIGYKVDNIKLIDEGFVSPGGTSEMISIYFSEVSEKIGDGGGVENEDEEIDIIEMSRDEMLKTQFKDFKTIIAVQWARYNHNI